MRIHNGLFHHKWRHFERVGVVKQLLRTRFIKTTTNGLCATFQLFLDNFCVEDSTDGAKYLEIIATIMVCRTGIILPMNLIGAFL